MMNTHQQALYDRLQSFAFDSLDDDLTFSQRLANDNGWTRDYAQQAIEEYKRFVFLAIVADHPVTPSDQVDQVWHLHLSYTHSYWEVFCQKILKESLHHEPTRGGDKEQQKFEKWYCKTLDSYEHFFEEVPPIKVWSNASDRFDRDLNFTRVNTQQKWVVPKPPISRNAVGAILATLILTLSLDKMPVAGSDLESMQNLFLSIIFAITGFGLIQTLAMFLDALNKPSLFRLGGGGCVGSIGGCVGCGGCGGCGG